MPPARAGSAHAKSMMNLARTLFRKLHHALAAIDNALLGGAGYATTAS